MLKPAAAYRVFHRFGKFQIQRRVIRRGDTFIKLRD